MNDIIIFDDKIEKVPNNDIIDVAELILSTKRAARKIMIARYKLRLIREYFNYGKECIKVIFPKSIEGDK